MTAYLTEASPRWDGVSPLVYMLSCQHTSTNDNYHPVQRQLDSYISNGTLLKYACGFVWHMHLNMRIVLAGLWRIIYTYSSGLLYWKWSERTACIILRMCRISISTCDWLLRPVWWCFQGNTISSYSNSNIMCIIFLRNPQTQSSSPYNILCPEFIWEHMQLYLSF